MLQAQTKSLNATDLGHLSSWSESHVCWVPHNFDYDAFGTLLGASGTQATSYLFTGEQWDADLGMYFLRARYLTQNIGRFTVKDTFTGLADEPATLNSYIYCNNDPSFTSDPSGNLPLYAMLWAFINLARSLGAAETLSEGIRADTMSVPVPADKEVRQLAGVIALESGSLEWPRVRPTGENAEEKHAIGATFINRTIVSAVYPNITLGRPRGYYWSTDLWQSIFRGSATLYNNEGGENIFEGNDWRPIGDILNTYSSAKARRHLLLSIKAAEHLQAEWQSSDGTTIKSDALGCRAPVYFNAAWLGSPSDTNVEPVGMQLGATLFGAFRSGHYGSAR